MYATCLTCHGHLGENAEVAAFPVGARLAFDVRRGRLWVVCPRCGRWNLTALEERWEAIEECERLFRSTVLRYSTANVGLAEGRSGLALVRIGPALRPELAAWRYGRRLLAPGPDDGARGGAVGRAAARLANRALSRIGRSVPGVEPEYDPATWWRIHRQPTRVVDAVPLEGGGRALVLFRHLESAELIRPGREEPWRVVVHHEIGPVVLAGVEGLRGAGKLLAALNGLSWSAAHVEAAVRRLDEAGDRDSYFARVAAIALRTSWGRDPGAARDVPILPRGATQTEQVALLLTNRSFWARGAIGSEPRTELPRLPIEDRLALEMAAHEDAERRALEGELADLEDAWREAEEIADIADRLFALPQPT